MTLSNSIKCWLSTGQSYIIISAYTSSDKYWSRTKFVSTLSVESFCPTNILSDKLSPKYNHDKTCLIYVFERTCIFFNGFRRMGMKRKFMLFQNSSQKIIVAQKIFRKKCSSGKIFVTYPKFRQFSDKLLSHNLVYDLLI